MKFPSASRFRLACLGLLFLLAGCRPDMFQQPKYNPLSASDFFPDGAGSRPLAPGTVARGHLEENQPFYTGKRGTNLLEAFPMQVSRSFPRRQIKDRARAAIAKVNLSKFAGPAAEPPVLREPQHERIIHPIHPEEPALPASRRALRPGKPRPPPDSVSSLTTVWLESPPTKVKKKLLLEG